MNISLSDKDKYIYKKEKEQYYNKLKYYNKDYSIKYVLKNRNRYVDLFNLIYKFVKKPNIIIKILFNYFNEDDIKIMSELSKHQKPNSSKKNLDYVEVVANNMRSKLKEYGADFNGNIFDYGCGDCIFINTFGKLIQSKKVHGADLETVFEEEWITNSAQDKVVFEYIKDNVIPFKTVKFSIIFMLMVLHHIPYDDGLNTLKQIYNMLETDGLFVIKEHDCYDIVDKILFDLEHKLYIASSKPLTSEIIAQNDFFYYDIYQLKNILENIGFKIIYHNYSFPQIKNKISPNRNYLMICKKNC